MPYALMNIYKYGEWSIISKRKKSVMTIKLMKILYVYEYDV